MKRYEQKSLLAFILFWWHLVAVASISVQVDPSTVQLGETFRVTFSMDNPQAAGIPDLTPLQQDFMIVGTERNMSYSIVNGQTQSVGQWTVLLTAKKIGVLSIPSIRIGHQQSLPTRINVIGATEPFKADDEEPKPQERVILKTQASASDVFVNQQIIYTVKLYNNQRLLDAEYTPPRVEDALIVPLGDGRHYETMMHGQNYAVEEQQYAIFPQKSGELTIRSPSFSALVFDTVPQRIKVHGETTNVQVKPKPSQYNGKGWLPAKQLALSESYDETNSNLMEGSTLTRTVTLQAAGVPAQLLPNLTFPSTHEFNVYPQKPELHNTVRQSDLIGRVDIKVTYILNHAGRIEIPAIHVPWFNSETGKGEVASLPARTIEVEAKKGDVPQEKSTTIPVKVNRSSPPLSSSSHLPLEGQLSASPLAWWLAGGFACAWVLTLILWWYRRRDIHREDSKTAIFKALHHACKTNNRNQAQSELLRWAAIQWPEAGLLNLDHLAQWVHDEDLRREIMALSRVLYSQTIPLSWEGSVLWRCVSKYQHKKSIKKEKSRKLPPMNPD